MNTASLPVQASTGAPADAHAAHVALEAAGLCKRFGALQVTQDVSLKLASGARCALIGPNGAGKTTLVNLLTGVLRADAGQLRLFGEDMTHASAAVRTRRGLVRTFQISSLFGRLTVIENIYIALAQARGRAFDLWRPAGRQAALLEQCEEIATRLALQDDLHRPVVEIAYGRQRLVEMAIALALSPRVLLLDEPAAGIPSNEIELLHSAIDTLPRDIAVLMIEHDMEMVRRFASEVAVLVDGSLLMSGTPREVMAHPQVQAVYLGNSASRRLHGALAYA